MTKFSEGATPPFEEYSQHEKLCVLHLASMISAHISELTLGMSIFVQPNRFLVISPHERQKLVWLASTTRSGF